MRFVDGIAHWKCGRARLSRVRRAPGRSMRLRAPPPSPSQPRSIQRLHDRLHCVRADLSPHVPPNHRRISIMEASVNASVGNLLGERLQVCEAMGNSRRRRHSDRDLGYITSADDSFDNGRDRCAYDAVRAGILWVHWRHVNRLPRWHPLRFWIAINISITNCRNRTPEIVVIFRLVHRLDSVRLCNRNHRHEDGRCSAQTCSCR